jgi:hypothetical protein
VPPDAVAERTAEQVLDDRQVHPPPRVGTWVTSAAHGALGSSGSNSRSRTFPATGIEWFESVVCRNFLLVFAAIPASRRTSAALGPRGRRA